MPNKLTKLQQSYDSFLTEIIKKSNLFNFNPKNLEKERKKFLKDQSYNPQFTYESLDNISLMYKDVLSSLIIRETSKNNVVNDLLISKQKELNNKFKLCSSVGTSSFTKNSIKVYGKPSLKLVKKAKEILLEPYKIKRKKYILSDEVKTQLRKSFKDANIKGWKVKKADLVTSALVNCEKKVFYLKKRERMQQGYVNRLKVHEIGTHAVRFENGRVQPIKLLKYGLANYLATEEGLAMYSEEICGVSSQSIRRNYAGRVLAVHYALENSFKKTYQKLLYYFKPKIAFKLTVRAKRGLADTSKPGGFTKDLVYLKGYFDVRNFAKKNNLKDLYIGKVGIKDLSKIKQLDFLEEPVFLPPHLK